MHYLKGKKDEYIKTLKERKREKYYNHSTERYDSLIKSVDKIGYDYNIAPIILDQDNDILDGMHRLTLLLDKYGEEFYLINSHNHHIFYFLDLQRKKVLVYFFEILFLFLFYVSLWKNFY